MYLKGSFQCPITVLIDKTFDYKSTHEDREEEQTCRYQDGEDRKRFSEGSAGELQVEAAAMRP